jgi:murein DD-endopeptidase MepM/ murein hydrolase activator NlpD
VVLAVLLAVAAVSATATSPMAATAADADPAPLGSYLAPVTPLRLLHAFDPPPERWLAGHRGVDLAADVGQQVLAPRAGVVSFVGKVVDRGVLTIAHSDGRRSSFEPVSSDLTVGDRIAAGQLVGEISAERSHCGTACLHWGVREGDVYINPLDVLSGYGPVRLITVRPLE